MVEHPAPTPGAARAPQHPLPRLPFTSHSGTAIRPRGSPAGLLARGRCTVPGVAITDPAQPGLGTKAGLRAAKAGGCGCPTVGYVPPGAMSVSKQEEQAPHCATGPCYPLVHKVYKYRGCMYTSYVYMYIQVATKGDCTPVPDPSLVPGVTVEGAGLGTAGRGVEDSHAAATGADDVGDEAGTVTADVAQDGALGIDVRELLFHSAPACA